MAGRKASYIRHTRPTLTSRAIALPGGMLRAQARSEGGGKLHKQSLAVPRRVDEAAQQTTQP